MSQVAVTRTICPLVHAERDPRLDTGLAPQGRESEPLSRGPFCVHTSCLQIAESAFAHGRHERATNDWIPLQGYANLQHPLKCQVDEWPAERPGEEFFIFRCVLVHLPALPPQDASTWTNPMRGPPFTSRVNWSSEVSSAVALAGSQGEGKVGASAGET